MKIDTSTVNLAVTHNASTSDASGETLGAWIGDKHPDFEGVALNANGVAPSVVTSISEAARIAAQAASTVTQSQSTKAQAIQDATKNVENDPQLNLIKLMVEMMTGRKVDVITVSDLQSAQPTVESTDPKQAAAETLFALKDSANKELGTVRTSGVFLKENAEAGTLQQIDLMA